MSVRFLEPACGMSLEPLDCRRSLLEIQLPGGAFKSVLEKRLSSLGSALSLSIVQNLWPSKALLDAMAAANGPFKVLSDDGRILAWASADGTAPEGAVEIEAGPDSKLIKYPWDILAVNEEIVGALTESSISGLVREGVHIDGILSLGEGSVLLPGVYIEGKVIIGRNSKVGPNCYIRGSTFIGDNCHVGQAVEIKNSLLMDKVAAGHLSYIGDSIVCPKTNFGAGTITANFRHDGKNHRSCVGDELVDTGRRKFGAIIGDNVHTGIHTSIYPGRKIWPDLSTRPGAIVQRDLKA